jgi:hypothetical protein
MSNSHGVRTEVYQNKYLPLGSRVVDAVISVTVERGPAHGGMPTAAQVVVIDCSASMAFPRTKLPEAKRATAAVIDALRDGPIAALPPGCRDQARHPAHGREERTGDTRRAQGGAQRLRRYARVRQPRRRT